MAVYVWGGVVGVHGGSFLESAWSSPEFIYPRPADVRLDLPQFVSLIALKGP